MSKTALNSRANDLFVRADKYEDMGQPRKAFRCMLAAAKLGDTGAQINVGNYYDEGKGVRRSRSEAVYWYKRAYRRGAACAANNIGVLLRNENKHRRALSWFLRAVNLGDDEAHLEIGKHYLYFESNPRKAIFHLNHVTRSSRVSEDGVEQASKLLAEAKRNLRR